MALTLEAARAVVQRQAATTVAPTLSSDEVDAILGTCTAYRVWAPATAYSAGQRVLPLTPNGFLYRVIVGGISGSVEPLWPLGTPWFSTNPAVPTWLGDGTVAWQLAEPAPGELYDTGKATHLAWLAKAAKASGHVKVTTAEGTTFDLAAVYQHCVDQAARWVPDQVVV